MAVTFCGRVVAIVGGHANLGLAAAVGERVRARVRLRPPCPYWR